jgi:transcriptional regulator GlxA family with amidase domain
MLPSDQDTNEGGAAVLSRVGRAHRVTALVFDGMKMLDLAGPFEVFAEAAKFGARYELDLCSSDGSAVRCSTGMRIPVDGTAESATDVGTALVVGGDIFPATPVSPELAAAAVTLSGRAARIASICTGAFVLAAAGLLDGRRATTHWQHTRLLAAAYPRVRVEPDAIYVEDGTVFTSAGVSAGIDLALALVERDHGAEVARSVAQSLVVFLQRPGGQSQFSPSLALSRPSTPVLRQITDAVAADPAADHSVTALAARAHISPRHLSRLFQQEFGNSPSKYVESVRVDAAIRLLHSGQSVSACARQVGIGSPETLRRIFIARVGVPPRAYQQRFSTTRHASSPTGVA